MATSATENSLNSIAQNYATDDKNTENDDDDDIEVIEDISDETDEKRSRMEAESPDSGFKRPMPPRRKRHHDEQTGDRVLQHWDQVKRDTDKRIQAVLSDLRSSLIKVPEAPAPTIDGTGDPSNDTSTATDITDDSRSDISSAAVNTDGTDDFHSENSSATPGVDGKSPDATAAETSAEQPIDVTSKDAAVTADLGAADQNDRVARLLDVIDLQFERMRAADNEVEWLKNEVFRLQDVYGQVDVLRGEIGRIRGRLAPFRDSDSFKAEIQRHVEQNLCHATRQDATSNGPHFSKSPAKTSAGSPQSPNTRIREADQSSQTPDIVEDTPNLQENNTPDDDETPLRDFENELVIADDFHDPFSARTPGTCVVRDTEFPCVSLAHVFDRAKFAGDEEMAQRVVELSKRVPDEKEPKIARVNFWLNVTSSTVPRWPDDERRKAWFDKKNCRTLEAVQGSERYKSLKKCWLSFFETNVPKSFLLCLTEKKPIRFAHSNDKVFGIALNKNAKQIRTKLQEDLESKFGSAPFDNEELKPDVEKAKKMLEEAEKEGYWKPDPGSSKAKFWIDSTMILPGDNDKYGTGVEVLTVSDQEANQNKSSTASAAAIAPADKPTGGSGKKKQKLQIPLREESMDSPLDIDSLDEFRSQKSSEKRVNNARFGPPMARKQSMRDYERQKTDSSRQQPPSYRSHRIQPWLPDKVMERPTTAAERQRLLATQRDPYPNPQHDPYPNPQRESYPNPAGYTGGWPKTNYERPNFKLPPTARDRAMGAAARGPVIPAGGAIAAPQKDVTFDQELYMMQLQAMDPSSRARLLASQGIHTVDPAAAASVAAQQNRPHFTMATVNPQGYGASPSVAVPSMAAGTGSNWAGQRTVTVGSPDIECLGMVSGGGSSEHDDRRARLLQEAQQLAAASKAVRPYPATPTEPSAVQPRTTAPLGSTSQANTSGERLISELSSTLQRTRGTDPSSTDISKVAKAIAEWAADSLLTRRQGGETTAGSPLARNAAWNDMDTAILPSRHRI